MPEGLCNIKIMLGQIMWILGPFNSLILSLRASLNLKIGLRNSLIMTLMGNHSRNSHLRGLILSHNSHISHMTSMGILFLRRHLLKGRCLLGRRGVSAVDQHCPACAEQLLDVLHGATCRRDHRHPGSRRLQKYYAQSLEL